MEHKVIDLTQYTPEINEQTSLRIQVAKAAYAYEILDDPIMDDAQFDSLSKQINTTIDTRRPDLDKFFREEFSPHTGQWIHNHPDIDKIAWLVEAHQQMARTSIKTYQKNESMSE